MFKSKSFLAGIVLVCLPLMVAAQGVAAQGARVAFGTTEQDRSAPVEVTSDSLNVDQKDNTAVFEGDVVIAQGEMRLAAPRVLVVYLADRSGIERLEATGGVTLVSGEDAAEANRADYNITTGMIELRGDVLLVQGQSVITGNEMLVDTGAGTARVTGQVRTVLQPDGDDR